MALPRILVAAPSYLDRAGTPRTPAELSQHNCLDPSGLAHFTWEFLRPDTRTNIVVSGAPRANSSTLIRQAAIKGLGVAMLREYLVRDNLKDGSLVRVLADYEIDERKLYIVYQKDRYQPMRMRIFIKHLFSRLKEFDVATDKTRARAAATESRP